MATIEKRGNSYRITVSQGYDLQGKQIRAKMTWTPEPGMTPKQIQKELNKQAVLFEERAKHTRTQDGNIRLGDFTKLFMKQYAEPYLKPTTVHSYQVWIDRIEIALGHIKLSELKPGHINALYLNLQEGNIRINKRAKAKVDFGQILADKGAVCDLGRKAGMGTSPISRLKAGQPISRENAHKIAVAMNVPYEDLFKDILDPAPLATLTVRGCHTTMLSLLNQAKKWGYISTNPAKDVEPPGGSRRYHADGYLDEPEVRRLLEILQSQPVRWRTPVEFALFTGLRRAELLGLRWCDVDMNSRIIHIRQTWNYVRGKGHYIDTPKTPTSERTVRISGTAIAVLLEAKAWQDHQREILGDAWQNPDDRIFTNECGHPILPSAMTGWFSRFARANGFPNISMHSLRHTYASIMIANGIPLVAVSRQLGHAQIGTTCDIYTHVISSAEAKAADLFDRFGDYTHTPQAEQKEPPQKPTKNQTAG